MVTVEQIPDLRRADVARILGVSPPRVDQLSRSGELPYLKTALGRLFDREDVERLRQQREEARRGRK